MASDLEVCNAALMRLGNEPIASFNDNSKRAKLCLAHYDRIKKDFISQHPWNFSLKRSELLADTDTFTFAEVNDVSDEITITGHGQSTGQRLFLKTDGGLPGGLSQGTQYYIIKVSNDVIKLATSYKEAAAGTNIDLDGVGTGTSTIMYAALFDFAFRYALPKDYLTVFRVEPDCLDYQREGEYIYSTEESIQILYQANTKEKEFSIYSYQALILTLAVEFSYTLIQSNELQTRLIAELDRALPMARLKDAQEGKPYALTTDAWKQARI